MLDADSKAGAALRKACGGRAPPLPSLFSVGQYVRCVVTHLGGGGDEGGGAAAGEDGPGRRRVGLSLRLRKLWQGAGAEALARGRCVPAVVMSVQDHVYTLGFGIKV